MVMPAVDLIEPGTLARFEPDPIPLLDAELAAEVGRLTAGEEGQSEIERIYRDYPGPVSRRRALLALSNDRLGRCIQRHVKKGATELIAICMDHEVILEVAYAPRIDWLQTGPVAQRKIVLPILRGERGPPEPPPIGQPLEGTW